MSKSKKHKKDEIYYYTEFDIGLIQDIRLWFPDIKFISGKDIETEYNENIIPNLLSKDKDKVINKENGVLILKTDSKLEHGILLYSQKTDDFNETLYTYDEFMVILSQIFSNEDFKL